MSAERPISADRSERAILGLCLRHPDTVDEAIQIGLTPSDFHDRRRRAIWAGCIKDREEGVGPDEATVLERHERNTGAGRTFRDFTELQGEVAFALKTPARREHLPSYVRQVGAMRERRRILDLASRVRALHASGSDTAAMREALEQGVLDVQTRRAARGFVPAGDVFANGLERTSARHAGTQEDPQLFTGIDGLDNVLRYTSEHYGIIAARPGMGKTQLALTAAQGIARRHGPVLYVMVEMGERSTEDRLVGSELEVVTSESLQTVGVEAADRWARTPVLFDFHSKTLAEVCSAVRVAKAKHGIVAFVVDYLQKIRLPRAESRERAVSEASDALCHLCHQHGVFGAVLSQLSRGVDRRDDKRPIASDLRESGSIEQDADSILFVYRDYVYNRATREPHRVELIVEKQRNGRANVTVPAWFKPGDGWFRSDKDPRWT